MAHAELIQHAAKDYPECGIKKGESYYKWSFRFGGVHRSKTRPKPSQLTQSDFLSRLYQAQEFFEDLKADAYETVADFNAEVENVKSDLEALSSDTQEKLDNMPEGLQQGDTGQLLENRVSEVESLNGEFDSLDYEEPEAEELSGAYKEAHEQAHKGEAPTKAQLEAFRLEKVHEKVQELLDEIAGLNWGIE
jgi:predicted  nucleic acid-binding Zn-ribbon protein